MAATLETLASTLSKFEDVLEEAVDGMENDESLKDDFWVQMRDVIQKIAIARITLDTLAGVEY